MLTVHVGFAKTASADGVRIILFRNATSIYTPGANIGEGYSVSGYAYVSPICFNYLDSPSTTSSVTYKTQFSRAVGSGTVYLSGNGERHTITLMEIAA